MKKTIKRIITGRTIKWLSPENRTVELHRILFEVSDDRWFYGYVESLDNIDENSVLYGIAYGSARIRNSNVVGVVGYGAIIEDSHVQLDDWRCADNWPEEHHDCRGYQKSTTVHLEGLHLKNCEIGFVDQERFRLVLNPRRWYTLSDEHKSNPLALRMFDFKEVYPAPDYQKVVCIGDTRYKKNMPRTVARLKSNDLSGISLMAYEDTYDEFTKIGTYNKGRNDKRFIEIVSEPL